MAWAIAGLAIWVICLVASIATGVVHVVAYLVYVRDVSVWTGHVLGLYQYHFWTFTVIAGLVLVYLVWRFNFGEDEDGSDF